MLFFLFVIIVNGVILEFVLFVVGIVMNFVFLLSLGYLNVCLWIFKNFCFKLKNEVFGCL